VRGGGRANSALLTRIIANPTVFHCIRGVLPNLNTALLLVDLIRVVTERRQADLVCRPLTGEKPSIQASAPSGISFQSALYILLHPISTPDETSALSVQTSRRTPGSDRQLVVSGVPRRNGLWYVRPVSRQLWGDDDQSCVWERLGDSRYPDEGGREYHGFPGSPEGVRGVPTGRRGARRGAQWSDRP
jgi:hypothetical protein